MQEMGKRKKVLSPVEGKDGKVAWRLLGSAFVNRDNSINVYLDGLPVNGKLQLRDWDDAPREGRSDRPDRQDSGTGQTSLRAIAPNPMQSSGDEIPF